MKHTAVGLSWLFAAAVALAEPLPPKALAIVYANGTVVPLAAYHDEHWERWWVQPGERGPGQALDVGEALNAPRSLADVPRGWLGPMPAVPTIWAVLRDQRESASRRRFDVHVTGLAKYEHYGRTGVGLRVRGFRIDPASTKESPAFRREHGGEVGVATTGGLAVFDITPPGASSPAISAIRAYLEEQTLVMESMELRRLESDLSQAGPGGRELLAEARRMIAAEGAERKTPLELHVFVADRKDPDGAAIGYFDASREYKAPGNGSGGLSAISAGWFAYSEGRAPVLIEGAATITSEADLRISMQPLAGITIGPAQYWLVANVYEDGADYSIMDVSSRRILIALDSRARAGFR